MTTTLPAVVTVLDLPTATTVTGVELFEVIQTVSGVQQSVQVSLNQIMTSIGGLPSGGGTSQLLAKSSGSNYSTAWYDVTSFVSVNATTGLATAGTGTALVVSIASGGVGSTQLGALAVQAANVTTNAIGNTQLRQGSPLSIIGVAGNATANVADIIGVTAGNVLQVNAGGTGLIFGALNTTGPNTVILTSGSGTYTVTANTKYIKIRLVGPGGGGSGSGTGAGVGGNGSATTTLSVNGGAVIISGGPGIGGGTSSNGGSGGAASGGNVVSITGGNGGSGPNGIITNFPGSDGAGSQLAAGGTGGNTGGAGFAGAGYGAGGGGGGEITTPNVGSGGGAGGYVEHIITNPAASYGYAVGLGGAAGTAGTGGAVGGAGFAGVIIIEEHFNY